MYIIDLYGRRVGVVGILVWAMSGAMLDIMPFLGARSTAKALESKASSLPALLAAKEGFDARIGIEKECAALLAIEAAGLHTIGNAIAFFGFLYWGGACASFAYGVRYGLSHDMGPFSLFFSWVLFGGILLQVAPIRVFHGLVPRNLAVYDDLEP